MRILVVDDDSPSRRMLEKYLEPWGEVDAVGDAMACIDAFRNAIESGDPYSVVFLDIVMPGMNGHEALRELRAIEADWKIKSLDETRIVMTSILEDPHTVIKAYNEGGATSYLVKPISRKNIDDELARFGFAQKS
ncbi:MAG: response regulator [Treponema sp.]|nr:response regulator [Treponema sp.]